MVIFVAADLMSCEMIERFGRRGKIDHISVTYADVQSKHATQLIPKHAMWIKIQNAT
jgi:hypothetical protein